MWFAYMDEAGNTGRNLSDPDQPIHLILTVAIEETRVMQVHEHVRATARHHLPTECRKPDFEFHGQDLFGGGGCFAGMAPSRRIAIYDDILAGLAIGEAEVFVRGVHKPRLAQRYPKPFHPHDIALMFTIESVERMARERGCRVLLVADEAREIENAALRDLAHYQELGTTHCRTPTPNRRWRCQSELSRDRVMGQKNRASYPRGLSLAPDLSAIERKRAGQGANPEARGCEPALSQPLESSSRAG